MKKIIVVTLVYLCLAATESWSQDSIEFYNRGLKSSLTYKKIDCFTKAIQLDPNMVEAYEKRALHYYFQRRFNKAIQDYTKVIELKPHRVDDYLMLGRAYLRKKKDSGIKAEIKNLVSNIRKHHVQGYNESLERAIESFNCAIEIDPQMASAYSYRAEAYRLKGMVDNALRDCTKAIALRKDPKSIANAYFTRAMIYRRLGQDELAEADFRKFYELDQRFYVFGFFVLRFFDDTPSLDTVSKMGLVSIIILAFVVIFRLTLRTPTKRE
ncbi:MAG: tetratricopeptide repeat protein [Desulfobacterales bacterium]|nr:MAG: tetratricopeptide repeat protein [Desulfobacterales bacterium]